MEHQPSCLCCVAQTLFCFWVHPGPDLGPYAHATRCVCFSVTVKFRFKTYDGCCRSCLLCLAPDCHRSSVQDRRRWQGQDRAGCSGLLQLKHHARSPGACTLLLLSVCSMCCACLATTRPWLIRLLSRWHACSACYRTDSAMLGQHKVCPLCTAHQRAQGSMATCLCRPNTATILRYLTVLLPAAAKRGAQSKDCDLAVLRDELRACKAQAGAAAEEAAAKLAHQASAARARHDACMQEYTHSFSKQVRGLPAVLWCAAV